MILYIYIIFFSHRIWAYVIFRLFSEHMSEINELNKCVQPGPCHDQNHGWSTCFFRHRSHSREHGMTTIPHVKIAHALIMLGSCHMWSREPSKKAGQLLAGFLPPLWNISWLGWLETQSMGKMPNWCSKSPTKAGKRSILIWFPK